MIAPRAALGFARSLVIYRARPWRIARLSRIYRSFVGPGDLAFDIGAHVGNRTLALVRAGARVVALEPQAPFHAFLRHTMPRAVTVLPVAAGAVEGQARLAVSRLHPTVSSLAQDFGPTMAAADPGFQTVAWDRVQIVETTTLDALIGRFGRPAFVKIDVEGFEAEVLKGLSAPVPALAFEFLPAGPQVTRACIARLAALGRYRFNLMTGERLAFALADWADGDTVLEAAARIGGSGDIYARLQSNDERPQSFVS